IGRKPKKGSWDKQVSDDEIGDDQRDHARALIASGCHFFDAGSTLKVRPSSCTKAEPFSRICCSIRDLSARIVAASLSPGANSAASKASENFFRSEIMLLF